MLIQDLRIAGLAAVGFKEVESMSAVTCAAFNTPDVVITETTRLVLGFVDGVVAMYALGLPPLVEYHTPYHKARAWDLRIQTTKVGLLGKMHRAVTGGVSAVKFVPGSRSRVVSVGHDGRCRLLDFEGGGRILRTWHVESPASALSIASTKVPLHNDTAQDHRQAEEAAEAHVAVGTQAGKVLLFNMLGRPLHGIDLEEPVVSIEWVGDMSARSMLLARDLASTPEPGPVIMSLIREVGDIEGEVSRPCEQQRKPLEREDVLQRRVLVNQRTESFKDADQVRTQAISRYSQPMYPPPQPLHAHTRTPLTLPTCSTHPPYQPTTFSISPPLRSPLSKDPVVCTGKAIWNLRKRSRSKAAPTMARSRHQRRRRSACCSSRQERSEEQEFFTPPATRWPSLKEGRMEERVLLEARNQEPEVMITPAARRSRLFVAERSQPVVTASSLSQILSANPKDESSIAPDRFVFEVSEGRSEKFSEKRGLRYISPTPTAAASSSHDLSSSLYSQTRPCTFRGDSTALDGGADTATPLPQSPSRTQERTFSFDAGQRDLEAPDEQQPVAMRQTRVCRGAKREDISRLHTDTETLRLQLCSLREEFEVLKGVLLGQESEKRWRACVS